MIVVSMLLALALVGPPKLPPLPGRGLPPPEAATEPETSTPAPATKPEATPPAVAAPAVASAQTPLSPPPAPVPTHPTIGTPAPDGALRVVGSDEVARWSEEDKRRASASAVPKTKAKSGSKPGPVLRTASEEPPPERLMYRRRPHPPMRSAAFVIGYRHFRIADALNRQQDWHLASLEVTPLRRYVRLNLITEFGIEGGEAARAGDKADMMLMERLGLGFQYPHFVTPLVEFQAGIGGARVELFQRNDLALLYTLGVDAGAQFAVTKWMYLHAVIGWIRPTFKWPDRSAAYDRFTFKVGIGF